LRGMRGGLIAGKVGYALSCLAAAVLLVVSGYAHKAVGELNQIGDGVPIVGSSSVGQMNILVMGLESRTTFLGQELDHHLQFVMHVGSNGSQDTDTLILVHIFPGGQKAVGYSIPRDDLVTYPEPYDGFRQGKIDGAYYFAYVQYLNSTSGSSMSQNDRYKAANRAGQAAEIATVEAVTGETVDNYVTMNLIGFYELAQDFGGVEVCVTPTTVNGVRNANLADAASGWDAVADGYNLRKGGSQYLKLTAAQSLAFVRDRDSLPDVDLSRTHRQQAVIDYVIWQLKNENAFADIGQLDNLLGDAKQYIMTNPGFNLLDFATNLHALTGKNLSFYTLPVTSFANVDLNGSMQDVNNIDVPYIQRIVKKAFSAPAAVQKKPAAKKVTTKATPIPAASTVTVDVYNGGSEQGLAGNVSAALTAKGYKAGAVTEPTAQSQTVEASTQVFSGAGTSANAVKIAGYFGTTPKPLASLPAGHVEILLGTTSTAVPTGLGLATQSTSSTATPTPSTTAGNNGAAGGDLTVGPNTKYGTPCVY
jgi:LCP family protein required for cell wall assembly